MKTVITIIIILFFNFYISTFLKILHRTFSHKLGWSVAYGATVTINILDKFVVYVNVIFT